VPRCIDKDVAGYVCNRLHWHTAHAIPTMPETTLTFNPAQDIPDLSGRVYLVTGGKLSLASCRLCYLLTSLPGTSGLGAGFVSLIAAKSPAKIFVSGRSAKKAEAVMAKVKAMSASTEVVFLEADLSSLASVQQLAKSFLAHSTRLDVLMCNAGVMALPPGLSKDGYEMQFATNHLGHALLTKLLLPALQSTAEHPGSDVRIVSLSSTAHSLTPSTGIAFDSLKSSQDGLGGVYQPSRFTRYGQSKLANLVYAQQLAQRYPGIMSVAVHPWFVRTDMVQGASLVDRAIVTMASGGKWTRVEEGPYNQTWAATTERAKLRNGAYYEPLGVEVRKSTKFVDDKALGERLWEWTERELEPFCAP
jgi:NAD(P)-dependent dehydrogenase (short-subunit alcohol dehydrogenase family)